MKIQGRCDFVLEELKIQGKHDFVLKELKIHLMASWYIKQANRHKNKHVFVKKSVTVFLLVKTYQEPKAFQSDNFQYDFMFLVTLQLTFLV